MSIIVTANPGLSSETAIDEMRAQGFDAASRDFDPGKTEPHSHDYDVSLYILEGRFLLPDVKMGDCPQLQGRGQGLSPRAPFTPKSMMC